MALSDALEETTMNLPPEIIDLIFDYLSNGPPTLNSCCFFQVMTSSGSKASVRGRLLHRILTPYRIMDRDFSGSLQLTARLSHTLRIRGNSVLAKASLDARPWIRAFR